MGIKGNINGDYLIDELNNETIEFINSINENRYVIFENLKDIKSSDLEKIHNDKIRISLLSGLNPNIKTKYNKIDYKKRTYYKPEELKEIVKYFEYIEKDISQDWTELQKTMYIHDCLIFDTKYVKYFKDKDIYGVDNALRTLTGNLYHELTCAGIALTFKVLLERQGIDCEYQNQQNSHSFNTVKIDGKYYGVDVTWDLNNYESSGSKQITYDYFGAQGSEEFYKGYHNLDKESEEKKFYLSTFTKNELNENHNVIRGILEKRQKHIAPVLQMNIDDKKRILGDKEMYHYLQDEYKILLIIRELKNKDKINENSIFQSFYNIRYPVVGDLCDDKPYIFMNDYLSKYHNKDIAYRALIETVNEYLENYVKNFFMDSDIYTNACKFNKDDETKYMNYIDAKKKIEFLLENKEFVIKLGFSKELNYFRNIYEKAINLEKSYNIENREEISQYEMDKDFFIGTMVGDVFDIKIFLEKEVGKELSKEEFKNYFTNVNFMKKKFPSLQKYQFSDYEYRNILNECFEEAFKENEDIKKK